MLTACGAAPPVFTDRTVEIPVAVVKPLPERLTADCKPAVDVPATGPLPVSLAFSRLAAVEDALAACRAQLAEIRTSQVPAAAAAAPAGAKGPPP